MATEVSKPRRKLSAILMVDVSGFSRMMGRDEEGTTARIREFHVRTRSLVEAHEGRVVDTAGDSVFGEFDSVVHAVRCAQVIQHTQAAINAALRPEDRIETRMGVHLGDVIVQDYHVYGDGVNIAARLEAAADPGGDLCLGSRLPTGAYKARPDIRGSRRAGPQEHRLPHSRLPGYTTAARLAACGRATDGPRAGE
jgi:class 3 adenylate cyclase